LQPTQRIGVVQSPLRGHRDTRLQRGTRLRCCVPLNFDEIARLRWRHLPLRRQDSGELRRQLDLGIRRANALRPNRAEQPSEHTDRYRPLQSSPPSLFLSPTRARVLIDQPGGAIFRSASFARG